MTYEELVLLKENLEILADERDPKTGYKVDDTILKNSFNKKVLIDAATLIDKMLKLDFNPTCIDKRKKYAFYMLEEDKRKVSISKEPIPISVFTYQINEHVNSRMKKLKAVQITSWLLKQGYLEEIEHNDGRCFKIITDKASTIGISAEKRKSESGRIYEVNLYNEYAQQFILDNLEEIIGTNVDLI